jgi:flagellar biosynthesis protein FlhB
MMNMSRELESTDLQPIKILGDTFSQIFGPLYLPMIVLATPTVIIQSAIEGPVQPGALPSPTSLAITLLSLVTITPLMTGAIIIFVHRYLRQSTLDLKDAFSRSLQILPQLILGLVLYILILIPAFFLIIPGILLSVQLSFVLYAIAIEGCSAIEGLKRSRQLVKGRWWKVLGATLLVLLVVAIPAIIIGAIIGGTIGLMGGSIILASAIGNLFGLLITPIFGVYYVKLYDRLCETTA